MHCGEDKTIQCNTIYDYCNPIMLVIKIYWLMSVRAEVSIYSEKLNSVIFKLGNRILLCQESPFYDNHRRRGVPPKHPKPKFNNN